jgi:hypothetical protein
MTSATDWGGNGVSYQRLWQQWWWIFQYSGMWCRVDWYIGTSASEEHAAFIFRTIYWISLKKEAKSCSETFFGVSYPRRWFVNVLPPPTKFWCLANSAAGRPVIRWIQQRLSLRARRDWDFKLDLEKVHVKEKSLRDMSVSMVQCGPSKHLLDETDCPLPSSMYRMHAWTVSL